MNRKLFSTLLLVMLMSLLMLSASVARADSLDITFDPAVVNAKAGDTVSLIGTISAPTSNAGTVYLDGDTVTLLGPFTYDDATYLFLTPMFLLPGQFYTGQLLSVTIDPLAMINNYSGTYSILQGSDIVGTGNFQIDVVPEPASMLLLGSGLTGLVGVVRRRRQK